MATSMIAPRRLRGVGDADGSFCPRTCVATKFSTAGAAKLPTSVCHWFDGQKPHPPFAHRFLAHRRLPFVLIFLAHRSRFAVMSVDVHARSVGYEDGSGEIEFGEFSQLCATFLVEDPDMETMKRELKDAFRIYDKEGLGYITTETLRGLI